MDKYKLFARCIERMDWWPPENITSIFSCTFGASLLFLSKL